MLRWVMRGEGTVPIYRGPRARWQKRFRGGGGTRRPLAAGPNAKCGLQLLPTNCRCTSYIIHYCTYKRFPLPYIVLVSTTSHRDVRRRDKIKEEENGCVVEGGGGPVNRRKRYRIYNISTTWWRGGRSRGLNFRIFCARRQPRAFRGWKRTRKGWPVCAVCVMNKRNINSSGGGVPHSSLKPTETRN